MLDAETVINRFDLVLEIRVGRNGQPRRRVHPLVCEHEDVVTELEDGNTSVPVRKLRATGYPGKSVNVLIALIGIGTYGQVVRGN